MTGSNDTVAELLARLVAFDTTSHKPNRPLIDFVRDYLAQHGVACDIVPNEDGSKANLFASIGPEGVPGVALSGHTDVVPVDGQPWTNDPFALTESDGRFYGRGTADMKGFIACALAAVPEFSKRKLAVPIQLAFSYDEEIGCLGVRPLIAKLVQNGIKSRAVIVGEPTSMRVVDAHKGPARWRVELTGRAAHSSMAHLGANAIMAAVPLLQELRKIELELMEAPRDERFEPPYATLQVVRIQGGTATNIVPVSCTVDFDLRALPDVDAAAIDQRVRDLVENECLPELRRIAPETDVTVAITNQVPPFAAGSVSEAVALALKLAGQNETHAVSYATEAGLFQEAGSPAVVIGPGDIAQAHTADEWVAKSQLEDCSAFLMRLADWAESGQNV